jgi:hypothetical protein
MTIKEFPVNSSPPPIMTMTMPTLNTRPEMSFAALGPAHAPSAYDTVWDATAAIAMKLPARKPSTIRVTVPARDLATPAFTDVAAISEGVLYATESTTLSHVVRYTPTISRA